MNRRGANLNIVCYHGIMAMPETEDRLAPGWVYQPMGLADLARAAADPRIWNEIVPYTQFCMDWNYYTENSRREQILEEDIRGVGDETDLPAIASVLHGLCERDGLARLLPDYLLKAKADEEWLLCGEPVDTDWARGVRDGALHLCWEHNIFYEENILYSTCDVMTSINKQL